MVAVGEGQRVRQGPTASCFAESAIPKAASTFSVFMYRGCRHPCRSSSLLRPGLLSVSTAGASTGGNCCHLRAMVQELPDTGYGSMPLAFPIMPQPHVREFTSELNLLS